jgi:hypothetical protein
MAIKKSDLYSSLWASCDELRGGMDASQYKDYILFMLFIKYISDKYGDSDNSTPPVTIPPWASFKDMVPLKGKSDQPQGKRVPGIGKGHGLKPQDRDSLPLSYMPCPEYI